MKNDKVQVQVRSVLPTSNGCAVFVGNEEKTFVIYVDHSVGAAIALFIRGTPKERPLTHDLMASLFAGLGVKMQCVVINDLKNSTYFARMFLVMENELGKKLLEIDARPSDSIAMAVQQKSPIYVARHVFNQVEDMSEVLDKMAQEQREEDEEPDEPQEEE
jgi:bifunctional DNase/RNase